MADFEESSQVVQRGGNFLVVVAKVALQDAQRAAVQNLRLVQLPVAVQGRRHVVQRGGAVGVLLPLADLANVQGLAVQRPGFVQPPQRVQHRRQIIGTCGHLPMLQPVDTLFDGQRALVLLHRLLRGPSPVHDGAERGQTLRHEVVILAQCLLSQLQCSGAELLRFCKDVRTRTARLAQHRDIAPLHQGCQLVQRLRHAEGVACAAARSQLRLQPTKPCFDVGRKLGRGHGLAAFSRQRPSEGIQIISFSRRPPCLRYPSFGRHARAAGCPRY
mmetsp:Transcript_22991/g.57707  ORF Transcript_22991/g.57707 Transcript_22991/m.57707 type:complete len:273 (-) Transcript_22991:258-1076(-)